jgi:hypothetical protein
VITLYSNYHRPFYTITRLFIQMNSIRSLRNPIDHNRMQALGGNLHTLAKNNTASMVALHVANPAVGDYCRQFEDCGFKSVKAPIRIGPAKPTGFSTTWSHMPLTNLQSFTLFKCMEAKKPTHNAWKIHLMDPNSLYRHFWCELQIIPNKDYAKTKEEIRLKVRSTWRVMVFAIACV